MMIWGELRTKAIKVYIDNSSITKRNFLGLGTTTIYNFSQVSGFRTSNVSSKSGTYEYLYIIVNDKKVIKISEYYHRNYKELKSDLMKKNIRNLGNEFWSFIKETKEIFT